MNPWLSFLAALPAADPALQTVRSDFVAPLADLGLIAVTGDDAASFLHNQLTNDVENLPLTEARLAGYCSPKGRLLATMLMWKTPEAIMLQLPHAIGPAIQNRLSMFVLRAKARLADVTDSQAAIGLAGPSAAGVLGTWFPTLPATPYAVVTNASGSVIRMPDAFGVARYQFITTQAHAIESWPMLSASLQPVDAQLWQLAEIDSGTPHITAPTQEQFVPQMINFELIGGVDFRKGCYPGQEIVARSQYLGKVKRRMLRASVNATAAAPGMEVFSVDDPEQPCGMIVNAEQAGDGGMACLVEIKLACTDSEVRLGSPTGPRLVFTTLPYPLTDLVL